MAERQPLPKQNGSYGESLRLYEWMPNVHRQPKRFISTTDGYWHLDHQGYGLAIRRLSAPGVEPDVGITSFVLAAKMV
jgi:hypothetical protein